MILHYSTEALESLNKSV